MYAIGYHGTTRRFAQFDISKSWGQAFYGRAIYLSSSLEDVCNNYGREGADNKNKTETFAERNDCTVAKARKVLGLHTTEYVLKCALTIKQPFMASANNWFPEVREKTAVDLVKYLYREGFRFSDTDFHEEITSYICEGNRTQQVEKIVKDFCIDDRVENFDLMEQECDIMGEFFKSFIRFFGFDGIVQDARSYFPPMFEDVSDWEVNHYVLFTPKQVRIAKRVKMAEVWDKL